MKAYQNCLFTKAYAQEQARIHVASNKLKASSGKNCSIACMFDGYNHELAEDYYSMYPQVIYTLDAIYEGLEIKEYKYQFHIDFYDAIPEGGDTKQGWHNFMSQLMLDQNQGTIVHDRSDASKIVGLLYLRAAGGDIPTKDEFKRVTIAESSCPAKYEASSANRSAMAAYMSAMASGSAVASAYAASSAHMAAIYAGVYRNWQWQRDTLLQCMRDC